jgi:polyphosphate kinase
MRQGRPTFQSNWSSAEAAAFLWFETAEDLALALSSSVERRKSAAIFALDAIAHLKSNLASFLHSSQRLNLSRDQIVMCVDVAELDARLPQVMTALGVPDFKMPESPKRHAAPVPLPSLSAEAEAALRAFWSEEYELYHTCQRLAARIGLSG